MDDIVTQMYDHGEGVSPFSLSSAAATGAVISSGFVPPLIGCDYVDVVAVCYD